MRITRRGLMMGSVTVPWMPQLAHSQEFSPITIEWPNVTLDPKADSFAAVDTSGYTTCQVQVVDRENKVLLTSQQWGTEPNVPNGMQLQGDLLKGKAGPYLVRVVMRPTRKAVPSVAMVQTQGPGVNVQRLKHDSLLARFQDDPARPPGGKFMLDLSTNASVYLKIFKGEVLSGSPVYSNHFPNLPQGPNSIPWDLKTPKGSQVPSGQYSASLVCMPTVPGLHPTNILAFFGVA